MNASGNEEKIVGKSQSQLSNAFLLVSRGVNGAEMWIRFYQGPNVQFAFGSSPDRQKQCSVVYKIVWVVRPIQFSIAFKRFKRCKS